MGEAKRRKEKFGGHIGAYEVAYRTAATVFAFRYEPTHQSRGSVAILNEAVHYPRIPSVFSPDLPIDGTAGLSFSALDGIDARGIAAGHWVLVDPVTLSFAGVLDNDTFNRTYVRMTGTYGWFAERGGEEIRIMIDEQSRLISEGGDVIADPVEFSRGKVRRHGTTTFPADAALATQSALVVLTNGEGATQEQLAHLTALSIAARARLVDMTPGANADARFFALCQQGDPFPLAADLKVERFPDAAFSKVCEYARFITRSEAVRRYCKANGSPITVFVDLINLDEPVSAAAVGDFPDIAAKLNISDEIGSDAARSEMNLSNPAVGPFLAQLERYLSKGRHYGAMGVEGSTTVEVVDVDGVRHLIRTRTNKSREIIVWSLVN